MFYLEGIKRKVSGVIFTLKYATNVIFFNSHTQFSFNIPILDTILALQIKFEVIQWMSSGIIFMRPFILLNFTLSEGKAPPILSWNIFCIDVYIKTRIKMNVYYSGILINIKLLLI